MKPEICRTCSTQIRYEREVVVKAARCIQVSGDGSHIVYLTCDNGHTHAYDVNKR